MLPWDIYINLQLLNNFSQLQDCRVYSVHTFSNIHLYYWDINTREPSDKVSIQFGYWQVNAIKCWSSFPSQLFLHNHRLCYAFFRHSIHSNRWSSASNVQMRIIDEQYCFVVNTLNGCNEHIIDVFLLAYALTSYDSLIHTQEEIQILNIIRIIIEVFENIGIKQSIRCVKIRYNYYG